jgi:hypothetical protein
MMSRNKLYLFLTAGCLLGYLWLLSTSVTTQSLCIFKNITGIPCPSCGTTRSVLALFQGNISEAIFLNPMGLFMAWALIAIPTWLLWDLIVQRNSLYKSYLSVEKRLRNPWIFIPFICLMGMNWIWNIIKQL